MTAAAEPFVVTEPGLVYDLSDEVYHGDPVPGGSLSSTFARLLTEHVPAKARELRSRKPTAAMEFGTIAHRIALGEESLDAYSVEGLTVIDGDGRTKEVKEAKAAAIAAGLSVVGRLEYEQRAGLYDTLAGMVAALDAHPIAHPMLASGRHEVSAFWQDDATGVWLRARYDVLPEPVKGRRLIVGDYKTTADASERGFTKSSANFGYAQQADLYLRGLRALGIADDPAFVFIAQEKTKPYLVAVHQLDREWMEAGRVLNDRAIRIFAECQTSGEWPGYPPTIASLSAPAFYYFDHQEHL